ncbi:MAG TPA: hypothetical protein VK364_13240, partial [Hymenobacter sp.]|nr:hypothetical protein [Hymenobacter sp.]
LFFASSCLMSVAAWQALRDQPFVSSTKADANGRSNSTQALLYSGALLAGAWLLVKRLQTTFDTFPIAIENSDIILTIQIHVRRLLEGEVVYRDIDASNFGYPLPAAYLPAMWLPYVPADFFNQDYRWTAAFILLLGVVTYTWRLGRLQPNLYEGVVKLLLPFIVFSSVLILDPGIFGKTVEMTVVGYYLLLIASLFSRSIVWRGLAIVLCLLSRFSILFWVPFYLLLVWKYEGRRTTLQLVGSIALGMLVLYVLPFMSHDWLYIFKSMSVYTIAALGEWENHHNALGQPIHLYQGLGFAAYFYEYVPGQIIDKLRFLQRTHLTASILVICVAALICLRRQPRLDYRYVAMIVLKVYLAVFYSFIQVPYSYLMLVPIFCSLWLVLCVRGTSTNDI